MLRRLHSDSAFQCLFLQVDFIAVCAGIGDCMNAPIVGDTTDLDQFVCDQGVSEIIRRDAPWWVLATPAA